MYVAGPREGVWMQAMHWAMYNKRGGNNLMMLNTFTLSVL